MADCGRCAMTRNILGIHYAPTSERKGRVNMVEKFSNIQGLPRPGYKHPRERPSAEHKQEIEKFIQGLLDRHFTKDDPVRRLFT